jgi:capsid protein
MRTAEPTASLVSRARRALAELLTPEVFTRHEKRARAAGIRPNEFNRAVSTAYNFYEGLKVSRERTRIPHILADSDSLNTSWTRREHMSIARHLYANDGMVRGLINDVARYTVGCGLKPQAQSRSQLWNEAAEQYWEDWCFVADFSRMHHFDHLQMLWQIGEIRDGDIGMALVRDPATGLPQVQTIRGHRIGTFAPEDNENVIDGVRVDGFGRPVSYQISTDKGLSSREIPSNSFILHYEPQEADAIRGLTALHHAINHVRDKKDTIGFEKVAIKNLSSFTAVMKTKTGTVDEAEWNDDAASQTEPTNITLAQMQSGQIPVISTDEEIQAFQSDRPSPAFMGFLEFLIREISTGLGVPYEFAWNAEKIGGATVRFVMEKAQRRFEERRKLFVNGSFSGCGGTSSQMPSPGAAFPTTSASSWSSGRPRRTSRSTPAATRTATAKT